ncbi:MAG: 23S rRNA methyltransferase, partial [Gammaproteobacteria bacterium]|nr:23S rRNA methyltransferase [Gammaproteobacteria bacterium]
MARSKGSQRWLREHFTDPYVKEAQKKGYRSRAVFKLQEINARDRILKPGMIVVDLGAAPGGWSQEAAKSVGARGRVIALDILPMEPLPGVEFMQADFTEAEAVDRLLHGLKGAPVH